MLRERTHVDAVGRLDAFYGDELGCEAACFHQPGLHLVATRRRTQPGWRGFVKPIEALARGGSLVISCAPDLENRVRSELTSGANGPLTIWAQYERLRRVSQRAVPYAFTLSGYAMYCEPTDFRPSRGQAVRLSPDDPRGHDLRSRFDGEIFVVFGARRDIASWAAIKLKSDEVWEIAVVTETNYRGQGFAREVVSAATEYILDHRRVPLYIYDRSNTPSGKVCRSLGYREHGSQFFCEY